MAINLHEKYSDQLAQAFTTESLLAGKSNSGWKFDGVKTLHISSIITQDLGDYSRTATSNRYGTPAELQDQEQEVSCAKDRSFSIVIDKGNNNEQQMIKKAGVVMKQQIREKVVPEIDKRALTQWARGAGTVLTAAAATSASTVITQLLQIETAMDDLFVPTDNRFVAMKNVDIGYLRTSLTSCDTVTDKMLLKGVAGMFGSLHIVGVPSAWMPTDAYMVAWHKDAVVEARKIAETKLHLDPPGFSGSLLEGRYIYDGFVIGPMCDAVVVLTSATYNTVAPTATKGSTTTALASTTNSGTVTIKYTVDGSDPRFSATATTYSTAITNPTAGVVIKAVAYYDDTSTPHYYYNSTVLSHTCV